MPCKASLLVGGILLLQTLPAAAAEPPGIAVFDMQLINTSPAPSTPEEIGRTRRISDALRTGLAASGRYRVIDTGPVQKAVEAGPELRSCNGCELDYARSLGTDYVAVGWVQKVSNLILNINLEIEDVATGKAIARGSVDIRGNTDEAWQRGLTYLLDHRILEH